MTVWGRVDLRCGGNPWRARQRAWRQADLRCGGNRPSSFSYVVREGNQCSKAGTPGGVGGRGFWLGVGGAGFAWRRVT